MALAADIGEKQYVYIYIYISADRYQCYCYRIEIYLSRGIHLSIQLWARCIGIASRLVKIDYTALIHRALPIDICVQQWMLYGL